MHSRLVEHLRPDNPLAQAPFLAPPFSLTDPTGACRAQCRGDAAGGDGRLYRRFQADDVVVLLAMPLLLLCAGRPTGRSKPRAIAQSNHARSIASPILQ